ncbi:MAG: hypothetical protein CL764_01965 [Chloroflexi bacterium]|nr:hypothetical protein [Chloroflexota bacterium]|tara:strand:+ start:136 stop:603 length:468 start_codon:yes stop_codon:yes gene_type:complete
MIEEKQFLENKHPILIKIMDLIVPAIDDLPGAGSMGLLNELKILCKKYPKIYFSIRRIINSIEIDPISRANGSFIFLDIDRQIETLKIIELNLSDDFSILINAIYSVYYMNKDVKKRINWKYNSIQPQGFEILPWDESILVEIKKIKPFWKNPDN